MKYKHIAQTALVLLSCCIANADTQKFEDVVGEIIEWKPGEIKRVIVDPAEEKDTDDLLSKDDLEKARTQLKESISKGNSLILIDRDNLDSIEDEGSMLGKNNKLGEADAIIKLQGSTFENKVKIVVTVTKIVGQESQTIIVIKLPSELGVDLEKNLEASAALVAKAVNDSLGMYKMFQVIENNTNKEMANIAQQRTNELSDSILKLISDISILDANTYKLVFQKQANNLNIDLLEANQTKYIDEKHRRQVRFIKELKILCDETRDKGGLVTPSNEQIISICRNIWQEGKSNL